MSDRVQFQASKFEPYSGSLWSTCSCDWFRCCTRASTFWSEMIFSGMSRSVFKSSLSIRNFRNNLRSSIGGFLTMETLGSISIRSSSFAPTSCANFWITPELEREESRLFSPVAAFLPPGVGGTALGVALGVEWSTLVGFEILRNITFYLIVECAARYTNIYYNIYYIYLYIFAVAIGQFKQ